MGSIKIWSNRKITIVSLSLFMFVCAIVITGYIYMNECVKAAVNLREAVSGLQ